MVFGPMFTPQLKVFLIFNKILGQEDKKRMNKKSREILFISYFA